MAWAPLSKGSLPVAPCEVTSPPSPLINLPIMTSAAQVPPAGLSQQSQLPGIAHQGRPREWMFTMRATDTHVRPRSPALSTPACSRVACRHCAHLLPTGRHCTPHPTLLLPPLVLPGHLPPPSWCSCSGKSSLQRLPPPSPPSTGAPAMGSAQPCSLLSHSPGSLPSPAGLTGPALWPALTSPPQSSTNPVVSLSVPSPGPQGTPWTPGSAQWARSLPPPAWAPSTLQCRVPLRPLWCSCKVPPETPMSCPYFKEKGWLETCPQPPGPAHRDPTSSSLNREGRLPLCPAVPQPAGPRHHLKAPAPLPQ